MARGRRGAYKAEKRRKELKRLAKKEAKRQRRVDKGDNVPEEEKTEDEKGNGETASGPKPSS